MLFVSGFAVFPAHPSLYLIHHREPGQVEQFMVQQIGNDLFFDFMMEGEEDGDQEYLDKQNFPGFSMGYIMYLMIGQQDDELKQEDE